MWPVRNPAAECNQDRTHRRNLSVSKNRKCVCRVIEIIRKHFRNCVVEPRYKQTIHSGKNREDPSISYENMQL